MEKTIYVIRTTRDIYFHSLVVFPRKYPGLLTTMTLNMKSAGSEFVLTLFSLCVCNRRKDINTWTDGENLISILYSDSSWITGYEEGDVSQSHEYFVSFILSRR